MPITFLTVSLDSQSPDIKRALIIFPPLSSGSDSDHEEIQKSSQDGFHLQPYGGSCLSVRFLHCSDRYCQ